MEQTVVPQPEAQTDEDIFEDAEGVIEEDLTETKQDMIQAIVQDFIETAPVTESNEAASLEETPGTDAQVQKATPTTRP